MALKTLLPEYPGVWYRLGVSSESTFRWREAMRGQEEVLEVETTAKSAGAWGLSSLSLTSVLCPFLLSSHISYLCREHPATCTEREADSLRNVPRADPLSSAPGATHRTGSLLQQQLHNGPGTLGSSEFSGLILRLYLPKQWVEPQKAGTVVGLGDTEMNSHKL